MNCNLAVVVDEIIKGQQLIESLDSEVKKLQFYVSWVSGLTEN
jgi:hypothetical protein